MEAKQWIRPADRLPEPGKLVWVLRKWTYKGQEHSEVRSSRRYGSQPLVTSGHHSKSCYWGDNDTGTYNDQTVAGWQEIPPLADIVRACNAHDDLVKRVAELERDLKAANEAFSLWYFVMDEAPLQFEEIVSSHSPAVWMSKAAELRRAKAGAA